MESPQDGQTKVLVGWFCPWAQRAWMVANICNRNNSRVEPSRQYTIVNDDDSIVLDTDNKGRGSKYHTVCAEADGVSRYMLKSPMLGNHSVPAIVRADMAIQSGDSIGICKWIWNNGCQTDQPFDVSETVELEARKWSDLITKPFYNSLMNRDHQTQLHYIEMVNNMNEFGNNIVGPFFLGATPSLVDVAVLPFIYRIVSLQLFRTYRFAEIGASQLQVLEIDNMDVIENERQLRHGILFVISWFEYCLQMEWFTDTLPRDAHEERNRYFYSQSLSDLYRIYALGIGLKSVNCTR